MMRGESSAHDIAKERFGLLTALRPVERHVTRGIVWLCRCDCGALALRTVAALNRAKKLGRESSCRACVSELRGGYFERLRLEKLERLAARVAAGYGLWTLGDDNALETGIRDQIAEDLGFYPEEHWPNAWIDPCYFDQSPDVEMVSGGGEKCVNLISDARKDPVPDLSLLEGALKRARELELSNEDQKRAMQNAIFFSHAGGDTVWLSLEQLAVRWNCGVATVKFFVERGLPIARAFTDLRGRPVEQGVFVPKADHWLAGKTEGAQ